MADVNKSRRGLLGLLALAPIAAVAAPALASTPRYARATLMQAEGLRPMAANGFSVFENGIGTSVSSLGQNVASFSELSAGSISCASITGTQIASGSICSNALSSVSAEMMTPDLKEDLITRAFTRLQEMGVDLRPALDHVRVEHAAEQGPVVSMLESLG